MNTASKLFGIICFAFLLVAGIGPANLQFFIDPPSLIIVGGGALTLLFASLGIDGVKRVFLSLSSDDPEQHAYLLRCLKFCCLYFLGSGALGTLVGLILTLQNLDDPSALGPGMAVSSLPHIYGVFATCCVLPFCFNVSSKVGASMKGFIAVMACGMFLMPLMNMGIYLLVLGPFVY